MIARRNGRVYECVVVDLNTQRDFCADGGAFPVRNQEALIPCLRKTMAWIKWNHVPVISSVQSHRLWEVPANGRTVLCCIDGTTGQRKVPFTLLPTRVWIEVDNTLGVPGDLFHGFQQVIFRKRTEDLLANPKADRFLTQLHVDEFVLLGNGIECSVKALALGLLARGKRVTVVVDACGFWDISTADLALRQIAARGARLISIHDLALRRLDRRFRYPIHRNGHNGQSHSAPAGNGRELDIEDADLIDFQQDPTIPELG